ncbi:MAG: hypothetical protein QW230_01920 [Thermofilum sp.]
MAFNASRRAVLARLRSSWLAVYRPSRSRGDVERAARVARARGLEEWVEMRELDALHLKLERLGLAAEGCASLNTASSSERMREKK